MEMDPFRDMEGLTIEGMRSITSLGRHVGKLQLYPVGARWVLVYRPPGQQVRKNFYLMGEKSRRPRLFAKADTALGIARTMIIPGIWVHLSPLQGVPYEPSGTYIVDPLRGTDRGD
jgi:hypothetical protein